LRELRLEPAETTEVSRVTASIVRRVELPLEKLA